MQEGVSLETTLICLSHLRWDHVWQRPHHLMARLSQHVPIIFVEEPWLGEWEHIQQPCWEERPGLDRVRVVRPLIPMACLNTPGNSYEDVFLRLFQQLLPQAGSRPIVWEYSPMMEYLTAAVPDPSLVVYDCMDELANFRGAPVDIRDREARLMKMAALVFTGGRSMYEARKDLHPNVHWFSSGVDTAHYQQALLPTTAEPSDVAQLPHPRLGYFGVLDERLDWDLVAQVATARPDWQWIFVGPTAKIDPADLPQAANLHFLGQRSYNDLPAYLKSFDVATMPFAHNEATRFISPTKTLEYMAGHAPIVSTSVPDVVRFYRERVHLADDATSFVAAVETALRETPAERASRAQAEDALLADQSWDSIATRMWALIEEQVAVS